MAWFWFEKRESTLIQEHAIIDIDQTLNEMSLQEQEAVLSNADFWSVAAIARWGLD